MPAWTLADILAPSIALGHVFGRIGCLLNGCCYGRECHLPWAIRYPAGQPNVPTTPVHPTQVYEAVLNLGLYVALAWLYRRKKFQGQIFAFYLVGYAVVRSVVECFRGDYPLDQLFFGGRLTPAHLVSAVVLVMGLVLLRVLPRLDSRQD